MDNLGKIKAEIERLKEKSKGTEMDTEYTLAWLLDFIDSLPEEPMSEDLEEEATRLFGDCKVRKGAFYFGAKWKEEQFEKNRLAACDAQTKEEAEREMDFVIKMIKEEHRQPTYSDAIEYGIRLQKEKDDK